jgi:8-amino-7-oxononanoate synthase
VDPALSPDLLQSPPGSIGEELASDLAALDRAGLLRRMRQITSRQGAEVQCGDRTIIDFSSNDYLGLASDDRIARAAQSAAQSGALGAAAARLVSGNHTLHERLESELARFKRSEAALLFSSGYMANIGAIPALVGRRDVIYSDELNHASLIDACRLSRAELRVMPHGDVSALGNALAEDAGRFRRRLIVVDSVFSMHGDLYPLDALVAAAHEHGAWTYVDDAHGTGVLGPTGRGAVEHWGVEGDVDVVMGTMGKALGVSGAFVAGSRVLVDFLLNRARSFVFTTGTPPLLAAACLTALDIAEKESWRRDHLLRNARQLREGLRSLGFPPQGADDGHIVPVILGDSERTMQAGSRLFDEGFLVGAIRPPTVPMGQSRLRVTISAAHEPRHISGLLAALDAVLSGTARTSE